MILTQPNLSSRSRPRASDYGKWYISLTIYQYIIKLYFLKKFNFSSCESQKIEVLIKTMDLLHLLHFIGFKD